ncbi:MAG: SHOCT domain-containing protein [Arenimonas sp.]
MSDITNELIRLGELREKGLITQDEFNAAKSQLLGQSAGTGGNGDSGGALPPTAPPPLPPQTPPQMLPPSRPSVLRAPKADDFPPGIKGWSWGAFLLNWIWAIFNRTWIGLLALIPFVNIFMIFVLGFKGREWAWKNNKWDSVEHFNRVQRKWSQWAVWLTLASIALAVLISIASFVFMASAGSKFEGYSDPSSSETTSPVISDDATTPATYETESAAETAGNEPTETVVETPAAESNTTVEETSVLAPETTSNEVLVPDQTQEQEKQHQAELATIRAEAAAAKAEAAKAKKDALKAEKELQAQRRLQEQERQAQELAAQQEQIECPYSRDQPLTCSSRQGQPAYCDWDFQACGNPRLSKKESKTTCDGKISTDRENNQLIVTDGCRGKFVPQQE